MKNTSKTIIISFSLLLIICVVVPLGLVKLNQSPGLPSGNCAVDALLLDSASFPEGTGISSNIFYDGLALVEAGSTFVNLPENIEGGQFIEYYNTPFLAWITYNGNHKSFFSHDPYNGQWTKPDGITYSSRNAQQYDLKCSENTYSGYRCMMMARYGRYFVFLRLNEVNGPVDKTMETLISQIDNLLAPCRNK